jgi:hypothetical protein
MLATTIATCPPRSIARASASGSRGGAVHVTGIATPSSPIGASTAAYTAAASASRVITAYAISQLYSTPFLVAPHSPRRPRVSVARCAVSS